MGVSSSADPAFEVAATARRSTRGELMLVCRVRDRLCSLDVGDVGETMRPLPIEPLAGAPPFVLGLCLIRGIATPVVDPGALVGAQGSPAFTRFVTLRLAGRRPAALAVEAVLGTRPLRGLALSELPPLLRDANPQLIASIGTLDRELLTVLETARLVPDSTSGARPEGAAGPERNEG